MSTPENYNNFKMKPIKKELIGIQPLIEIIELTLQTAFIKPYSPNSLIIIAKPESAKTQSIFQQSNRKWIYYTNEITAKMLIDEVIEKAKNGKIKFLMIPDILNCIEKQKSSRQGFLNTIKAVMDEGITNIQTYYKKIKSETPIKIGVITAITSSSFSSKIPREYKNKFFLQETGIRKYLEDTGILSRFVPFSYDYPLGKLKIIFDLIEGKDFEREKIIFRKLQISNKEIKGDPNLFKQLEVISQKLGLQYKAYGIRIQEKLQNLAKANAYINKKEKVNQEDIDKIFELSEWINFDFNPI